MDTLHEMETDGAAGPRVGKVVIQAHVWYDDDTVVTFTTPVLRRDDFTPLTLVPLIGDCSRWLLYMAAHGFPRPAGCAVVGMPFRVHLSDSFLDNPADSILTSMDYPGTELDLQVPTLTGLVAAPDVRIHPVEPDDEGL